MNAPFRLAAWEPDEDDLTITTADWFRQFLLPPVRWTKNPTGDVELSPAQARKLYRFGVREGWPDFQLAYGMRMFGIEMKKRDGALSRTRLVKTKRGWREIEGQREVFADLRSQGWLIAVCRDLNAVILQCETWKLPLRSGYRSGLTCEVAA